MITLRRLISTSSKQGDFMFYIPFLSISPAALIIGIASHMLIGMTWYSPLMFGSLWMKLCKINPESIKMHAGHVIGSAITGGTITIVLGHLLKTSGVASCIASIEYSTLIWLGFISTVLFSPVLWEKRPIELYLIGAAHWLVTLLVIGCVVTKL